MNLTPLDTFHTIVSLVAVLAAVVALSRHGHISPRNGIGRLYIGALVITCLTGLPIVRHGTIGPPHVLGVLTLVTLAVATVAGKTRMFGGFSAYVQTVSNAGTLLTRPARRRVAVEDGTAGGSGPESPARCR
jgi:uncharacterized membrane protein